MTYDEIEKRELEDENDILKRENSALKIQVMFLKNKIGELNKLFNNCKQLIKESSLK